MVSCLLRTFVSAFLLLVFMPAGNSFAGVYAFFPETFGAAVKTDYARGTVTLATGLWDMDDVLIGSSADDKKNGVASARLRDTAKLTMLFNLPHGATQVTVQHAVYGTDGPSTWSLWCSHDDGLTWQQVGANVVTNNFFPATASFTVNQAGYIRLQFRKLSGGRLSIDDITVFDSVTCGCGITVGSIGPTRDDNLALGNPSNATTSFADSNNLLLIKPQYALSYNNRNGMANWVSWHLSTAWKGSAPRCDCFTQDAALPSGYYRAATSHYTSTGFDRGHLCPSDDRDASDTDNAATFKMTNIAPQAPNLNQQTWENLESYCRTLISSGNELYIIAGGYGTGGAGSAGGTTTSIFSGRINVPAHYWKIIVVLPVGDADISRITTATRVIAVDMPNTQTVIAQPWEYYRTTTNAIEAATGYDFLSNLPVDVQAAIEDTLDVLPIP